jgi:tetratricopeptide (TPR) repeat protein
MGTMGNWLLGNIARLRGEYQDALELLERSLERAHMGMPMFLVLPLGTLGATLSEIGPTLAPRARELHAQALKLMESPMEASMGGSAWAEIGEVALAQSEVERADGFFQKGLNYPTTLGRLYRPAHLVGEAYVALARGQLDAAAKFVADAKTYAAEHSIKHFSPLLWLTEGRVCAARGDLGAALGAFAQAEALALGMGMRPAIMQARVGAANILKAQGRTEEASAKLLAARAMVEEMAALFRDDKLREAFVQSANAAI